MRRSRGSGVDPHRWRVKCGSLYLDDVTCFKETTPDHCSMESSQTSPRLSRRPRWVVPALVQMIDGQAQPGRWARVNRSLWPQSFAWPFWSIPRKKWNYVDRGMSRIPGRRGSRDCCCFTKEKSRAVVPCSLRPLHMLEPPLIYWASVHAVLPTKMLRRADLWASPGFQVCCWQRVRAAYGCSRK